MAKATFSLVMAAGRLAAEEGNLWRVLREVPQKSPEHELLVHAIDKYLGHASFSEPPKDLSFLTKALVDEVVEKHPELADRVTDTDGQAILDEVINNQPEALVNLLKYCKKYTKIGKLSETVDKLDKEVNKLSHDRADDDKLSGAIIGAVDDPVENEKNGGNYDGPIPSVRNIVPAVFGDDKYKIELGSRARARFMAAALTAEGGLIASLQKASSHLPAQLTQSTPSRNRQGSSR